MSSSSKVVNVLLAWLTAASAAAETSVATLSVAEEASSAAAPKLSEVLLATLVAPSATLDAIPDKSTERERCT